jgi:transcription-repair coupling factor (superfamily II helicase)
MVLPFVRELFADVNNSLGFTRAVSHLKTGAGRASVSGLTPTAKALLLPMLQRAAARPLLVIVDSNRAAEDLLPIVQSFADLTGSLPPSAQRPEHGPSALADSIITLPAPDVFPFEGMSPHPEIQEARAITLWKMATGAASVVIAPIAAVLSRFQDRDYYAGLARMVRRTDSLDLEDLIAHLRTVGYSEADIVEMPGDFALRGGILDVYPPDSDRPLRLELFGDEVESIRKFDPATQRSTTSVDEVALLPLTDTPLCEAALAAVHARLSGSRLAGSEQELQRSVRAGGVGVFPGWEFYAPVAGASQDVTSLLLKAAVAIVEPADVNRAIESWWSRLEEVHERSGVGNLVRPEELYMRPEQWQQRLATLPSLDLEFLGITSGQDAPQAAPPDHHDAQPESDNGHSFQFSLNTRTVTRFHGSVPSMVEEVQKLAAAGERILFAAANTGEVERLAEIFTEYNVPFRLGSRTPRPGESYVEDAAYLVGEEVSTTVVKAFIPDGVFLPDARVAIFGSRDLFDESDMVVQRPARQKSKTAAFSSDFRDLQAGDYVVHIEHGIGQYQGLREIAEGDGQTAEFMILEYAEGARLYVPLTRLDLVQKYRSAEGIRPPLSRLGTQQWAKTKARVKKAMKDMADDLLKLYAARKLAPGHAFPSDTEWQREFEDAFEFSETEDQITAIADIKRDMESSTPMDRLLCGDVGYGKTEVAMRAAFKAVGDNKQVAVLAPTTVLAFQHYETFKQRFAAFPLTIEMISRFRSAKEQKEIVEKVEAGKVDILIGTHRLLSKDIHFTDLGLVVVDEEQRFGVRHKERLKQLRKEVDVLTMSATPIPRTLHMSLIGLRDMSVIETPPKDRMAIETIVAAWDEKLVRSAIERELERGGQTYFVHNRVDTIYEIAARIQELVPRARVIVGHGQMGEGELEKVMLHFMHHEADVLVATTIIENGLDIPLCNTMIVNRADRHGLSELYQLRGRVGRSNRRAYAYLMVPPDVELTPIARRRLAALKEFSDLGAGFKIAALDLELRGAGNMLGGEQSGNVDAVGFELYTSMLERAVRELKGETEAEEIETQLNLGLNVRIPNDYIPEENQRLRMYKRVAGIETEQQLTEVAAELEDRYGPPPPAVRNLLEYATLKLLARRVGVAGIERKREQVSVRFNPNANIDPARLAQFVAASPGAQFTPAGILKFALKPSVPGEVLANLRSLLVELAGEAAPVA